MATNRKFIVRYVDPDSDEVVDDDVEYANVGLAYARAAALEAEGLEDVKVIGR